jgi:hypothetical protein
MITRSNTKFTEAAVSRIRLVTRADDAGLNPTVNRAIQSAARQGIVRNISLMAPAPAIEHAVKAFRDLGDIADFGLHVCLTSEWQNVRWGPVASAAEVPSLLEEEGNFPHTTSDLAALEPESNQVLLEVEAQFARLRELGFSLSYLDDHMLAVEALGMSEALSKFAEKHGLIYDGGLRRGGVITRLPGWDGPDEHPGTELADHLAATAPGTYLLVGHPGFKTEDMERLRLPGQPRGEVLTDRNRERRMFADIEIVDYCDSAAIDLLRYSQLTT